MKKCIYYLFVLFATCSYTPIDAQRVRDERPDLFNFDNDSEENATIIVQFDNERIPQEEITEFTRRATDELQIRELNSFQTCDGRWTFCLWQVLGGDIIHVIGQIRDQTGGNSCRNIPINISPLDEPSETPAWDNPYPYLSDELRHLVYGECPTERGGATCMVNIMDTGLDRGNNPIFGSNIKMGYNYISPNQKPIDDMWHGTHVAGIMARLLAPQSGLVDINISRAFNKLGEGRLYDIIHALADNMCENHVFNFSFSYNSPQQEDMFTDLMAYAGERHGCLFVVGSGNDGLVFGQNSSYILPAEAELKNMIAVYSLDNKGDLAAKSNFGQQTKTLRIGAPGDDVYSTVLNGKWALASGTSMAAPSIAAAAAILATYQNGGFNYRRILDIINNSKEKVGIVPSTGEPTEALDMCKAIQFAQEQRYRAAPQQTASARLVSQNISVSPNPSNGIVQLSFDAPATGSAVVQVLDLRGQQLIIKQIETQKGQNTLSLDLQPMPSGIYQVFMILGKERKAIKIFKN